MIDLNEKSTWLVLSRAIMAAQAEAESAADRNGGKRSETADADLEVVTDRLIQLHGWTPAEVTAALEEDYLGDEADAATHLGLDAE